MHPKHSATPIAYVVANLNVDWSGTLSSTHFVIGMLNARIQGVHFFMADTFRLLVVAFLGTDSTSIGR